MTVKQKAARAKFTKAIAEAKKLRAKNPKLTQAAAVKQAFAILYSKDKPKKVGAVKKKAAVKKAAPKKKAAAKKPDSYHKDTKSHNVNIRVMSGIKDLEKLHYNIYDLIKMVENEKKALVQKIVFNGKLGEAFYTKPEITLFRKQIIMLNKRISALKKLAKEQQKAEKYF
jgi:hypothetical protein